MYEILTDRQNLPLIVLAFWALLYALLPAFRKWTVRLSSMVGVGWPIILFLYTFAKFVLSHDYPPNLQAWLGVSVLSMSLIIPSLFKIYKRAKKKTSFVENIFALIAALTTLYLVLLINHGRTFFLPSELHPERFINFKIFKYVLSANYAMCLFVMFLHRIAPLFVDAKKVGHSICRNCGAIMIPDDRTCPECGHVYGHAR